MSLFPRMRRPFPVGQNCSVPISELHVNTGKVLRQVDQQEVNAIAEMIQGQGAYVPLTVKSNGEVVDGRHRLAALKQVKARDADVYVIGL